MAGATLRRKAIEKLLQRRQGIASKDKLEAEYRRLTKKK